MAQLQPMCWTLLYPPSREDLRGAALTTWERVRALAAFAAKLCLDGFRDSLSSACLFARVHLSPTIDGTIEGPRDSNPYQPTSEGIIGALFVGKSFDLRCKELDGRYSVGFRSI